MTINNIVKYINKIVANNSSFKLNYNLLEFYINSAVDYINLELKTEILNPQESWENNLLVNNLKYNTLLNTTYSYIGEYEENPVFGSNNDIYYNTSDDLYYIMLNNTWDILVLEEDENGESILENMSNSVITDYDYTDIPEQVIRSVIIYYTAASYLEEEDEFESQYKTYYTRAEVNLEKIRHIYYSMYDLNDMPRHHHHHKFKNPYGLPEGDD